MTTTQIPITTSEPLTLEITPTWKWEGDEYLMEFSASLLANDGEHILHQELIPVDVSA